MLWVAGRHQGKSGAARLDRNGWRIFNESDGVVGNNIATGYAAENGDLWFGTKHRVFGGGGGLMRFDEGTWTHYSTESGLINDRIYEVGQTTDGMIWVGTWRGLSRFDPLSEIWTGFLPHPESDRGGDQKIRSLSASRVVWVGQAANDGGVGRFDGTAWQWFTTKDGLVNDGVWEVFVSRDGIVWAATNDGLSRYDGVIWTSYVDHSSPASTLFHSIAETNDGALWMRGMETETDSPILVRHIPDRNGPETRIEDALDRVSSDGIIFLRWAGDDYFNDTSSDELRYQHRMNEEDWSRPTGQKAFTFTGLVHGRHRFEVRAIDRDGNIDPTPAVHGFLVAAPWWRDPVVAGPGLLLIIGILFQSARVVQAKRKLQASVDALSSANNELFQVNVDLQREQVLERLRGQAQGMQSSEDIKPVVEAVNRELSGLGLPLIGASIGIHLSETATEIWVTSEMWNLLSLNKRMSSSVKPNAVAMTTTIRTRRVRELKRAAHRHIERGVGMWNVWKDIPEDRWPKKIDLYWAFFEGGRVSVASEAPIAEEYLLLIKRFGEVFGFAHSRYKELQQKEAQNRRLAVEASVQRLRAEVQSMDEASDFERILSLLTESLKTVELTFDGCEIDVLDEPVEDPTMELFEQNGFRYTTFSLDPEGSVTAKSYNTPAPFPGVIEQTIERFIAGEPWQGLSDDLRIVEVPAGGYGRLRLTATDREQFTDDEVTTLREFADAVALGYARYLDIREIQLNTERKSEFLASMSHELRTPMNAIKGFTNLVLRREKTLSDRGQENLQKATQASDRLLAMIDDLMDLSKIEAGRMDVNPERFDVGELVTSACDTVSSLVQEGVELRQDVADDIGEANTDKARLQQMVINLLSNAIKFTDSGSVTVRASRGQGAGSEGEDLVIVVTDTGKGIPADELPTIFDEYRQAEGSKSSVQKGTGLGLSITKKFAELLDGTVGVESEAGKGSTFTVRVPVEYQEQT